MPEGTDKQAPKPDGKKYMLVRYGRMNNISLFEHREAHIPMSPTKVVIKTDKGLELGEIVGQLTCYKGGKYKWTPDQINEYYKVSEIDFSCAPSGRIVRYATADDLSDASHFHKLCLDEIETCRKFSQDLGLDMKVVDAEHILGGERIIFYFLAEGRVDFRQLVKKLSHELQTRIEMRQIGARDEAKLLGDVESCGQEICCRRFLRYLKPVNMRMAKMQKATLDPSKISGYCGRLKCCLRYEDKTYAELKKMLPRKNTMVQTEKGEARVLSGQILTQLILVGYENGERETVPLESVEILGPGSPRPKREPQQDEKGEGDKNGDRFRRGRGGRPTRDSDGGKGPEDQRRGGRRPNKPEGEERSRPEPKSDNEAPEADKASTEAGSEPQGEGQSNKPKTRRRRRSGNRSGRRRRGGRNNTNNENKNNEGGQNSSPPPPKPSGDA